MSVEPKFMLTKGLDVQGSLALGRTWSRGQITFHPPCQGPSSDANPAMTPLT